METKYSRFIAVVFFILTVSFLNSGCQQDVSKDEALHKRVAELEDQVKTLQQRADDQTLKARIAGSLIFKDPLDQFFNSPEFWENTYDSGQADCSKRCIADLQLARGQCAQLADENSRLQCYNDAAQRASACHTQCAQ